MIYIFPVLDIATDLYNWTKEFTTSRLLEEVELLDCVRIVDSVLTDSLSRKMIWKPAIELLDDTLEELIPWYHTQTSKDEQGEEVGCPTSDDYYYHVVDHAFLTVEHLVGEIIKEHTWDVWYVERAGSDRLLIQGEDYRVIEYTRLVEEGEIKVNSHLSRLIRGRVVDD